MVRILVADDDVEIEENLRKMGYDVVGRATTGEEAIEKAKELRPDLILMDIVMPGEKSGVEAAEKIKSEMDIPIIFLTAHADEDVIESAKKVAEFIVEPHKQRELKTAIEIALYEKETKLKRIGGIFDRLIEGVPTGSLVFFAVDPIIASDLVLYQLCGVRKTYYFVTERSPKRVEESMRRAEVSVENVEIIDLRKGSGFEIISTLKQTDDANLIIDSFVPFSEDIELVKDMQALCEGRDVLCFLVFPKGACENIHERRIAYICDAYFDLCADRMGDEVIVKFSAPKIRGVSPLTRYTRLKIEANRVEVDTSRDIV